MKVFFRLLVHLLVTYAKLVGPGGPRGVAWPRDHVDLTEARRADRRRGYARCRHHADRLSLTRDFVASGAEQEFARDISPSDHKTHTNGNPPKM